jgi:V/A-type H+-transporting ATPase subunit D
MDTLPTKRNLLLAKQNLLLARLGYNLLDMKLSALMRELKRVEKTASALREKLQNLIASAERALIIAKMEIGEGTVAEIWGSCPYKLSKTGIAYDKAFFAWEEVNELQCELAQLESVIKDLTTRKNRTKKRVSALRNVKIPSYEKRVKYISEQLEERERDEMIRLKTARNLRA